MLQLANEAKEEEVSQVETPAISPTVEQEKKELPSQHSVANVEQNPGLQNEDLDYYGLDEIRNLTKKAAPKRQKLSIGFYTVDAAKLLPDSRRENKRTGRTVYQKGLEGFDRKFDKLLNAIRDDNPFADSVLLDLEDAADQLSAQIAQQAANLEMQMDATFKSHNATVQYLKDDFITKLEPRFRHDFTMRLLWLVKEIDKFWQLIAIAQSNAIITHKAGNVYKHHTSKSFRSLLNIPDRYTHSIVSRKDLAQGTQTGIRAIEKLSDPKSSNSLRPEVLLMTKRSKFAPKVNARPYDNIDDIKDKLTKMAEVLDNTILPGARTNNEAKEVVNS